MRASLIEIQKLSTQMITYMREALEFGDQSTADGADLDEIRIRRQRIYFRCEEIKSEINSKIQCLGEVSSAELAFLQECRMGVNDLKPLFLDQEKRIHRVFSLRLGQLRTQLIQSNAHLRAARSYLGLKRVQVWH